MDTWGLIGLAVIVMLVVALGVWLYRDSESNRRRRRFLGRYEPHRLEPGSASEPTSAAPDTAGAPTVVLPAIQPASPAPQESGRFSGYLPRARRVRAYVLRPQPLARQPTLPPDPELMYRILIGLHNLD